MSSEGAQTEGCNCAQCQRDEPIDECTNCGQETYYSCTRVGGERLCERCYETAMEVLP